MESQEIIAKVQDLVRRSDRRFCKVVENYKDCQRLASGDIWDKAAIRKFKRAKRLNLNYEIWSVLGDEIASGITSSPWHTNLIDDKQGEAQSAIDLFENAMNTKLLEGMSFRQGVLNGRGYIHMKLINDNPELENITNYDSVVIDPQAIKPDLSDAKEGAICLPIPGTSNKNDIVRRGNWNIGEAYALKWIYYWKNEEGKVLCVTIEGDEVSEPIVTPFSRIPIIAYAGYSSYDDSVGEWFEGLVSRTRDVGYSLAINYSEMSEIVSTRSRNIIAVGAKTATKHPESIQSIRDANGAFVVAEGDTSPTMLSQNVDTSSYINNITACRVQMEDAAGIHLSGNTLTDRTATEILVQENSKDGKLFQLYSHAEMATRTIAELMMEALFGQVLPYELVNGPAAVTRRLQITKTVNNILPTITDESLKQYLGYIIARESNLPDDVLNTLRGNLTNLQIVDPQIDNNTIGAIVNDCVEAKSNLEEALSISEDMEQELNAAKMEAQQANQALADQKAMWELEKARMEMQWQQKQFEMQCKIKELELKEREMQLKEQEAQVKAIQEQEKINLDKAESEPVVVIPEGV